MVAVHELRRDYKNKKEARKQAGFDLYAAHQRNTPFGELKSIQGNYLKALEEEKYAKIRYRASMSHPFSFIHDYLGLRKEAPWGSRRIRAFFKTPITPEEAEGLNKLFEGTHFSFKPGQRVKRKYLESLYDAYENRADIKQIMDSMYKGKGIIPPGTAQPPLNPTQEAVENVQEHNENLESQAKGAANTIAENTVGQALAREGFSRGDHESIQRVASSSLADLSAEDVQKMHQFAEDRMMALPYSDFHSVLTSLKGQPTDIMPLVNSLSESAKNVGDDHLTELVGKLRGYHENYIPGQMNEEIISDLDSFLKKVRLAGYQKLNDAQLYELGKVADRLNNNLPLITKTISEDFPDVADNLRKMIELAKAPENAKSDADHIQQLRDNIHSLADHGKYIWNRRGEIEQQLSGKADESVKGQHLLRKGIERVHYQSLLDEIENHFTNLRAKKLAESLLGQIHENIPEIELAPSSADAELEKMQREHDKLGKLISQLGERIAEKRASAQGGGTMPEGQQAGGAGIDEELHGLLLQQSDAVARQNKLKEEIEARKKALAANRPVPKGQPKQRMAQPLASQPQPEATQQQPTPTEWPQPEATQQQPPKSSPFDKNAPVDLTPRLLPPKEGAQQEAKAEESPEELVKKAAKQIEAEDYEGLKKLLGDNPQITKGLTPEHLQKANMILKAGELAKNPKKLGEEIQKAIKEQEKQAMLSGKEGDYKKAEEIKSLLTELTQPEKPLKENLTDKQKKEIEDKFYEERGVKVPFDNIDEAEVSRYLEAMQPQPPAEEKRAAVAKKLVELTREKPTIAEQLSLMLKRHGIERSAEEVEKLVKVARSEGNEINTIDDALNSDRLAYLLYKGKKEKISWLKSGKKKERGKQIFDIERKIRNGEWGELTNMKEAGELPEKEHARVSEALRKDYLASISKEDAIAEAKRIISNYRKALEFAPNKEAEKALDDAGRVLKGFSKDEKWSQTAFAEDFDELISQAEKAMPIGKQVGKLLDQAGIRYNPKQVEEVLKKYRIRSIDELLENGKAMEKLQLKGAMLPFVKRVLKPLARGKIREAGGVLKEAVEAEREKKGATGVKLKLEAAINKGDLKQVSELYAEHYDELGFDQQRRAYEAVKAATPDADILLPDVRKIGSDGAKELLGRMDELSEKFENAHVDEGGFEEAAKAWQDIEGLSLDSIANENKGYMESELEKRKRGMEAAIKTAWESLKAKALKSREWLDKNSSLLEDSRQIKDLFDGIGYIDSSGITAGSIADMDKISRASSLVSSIKELKDIGLGDEEIKDAAKQLMGEDESILPPAEQERIVRQIRWGKAPTGDDFEKMLTLANVWHREGEVVYGQDGMGNIVPMVLTKEIKYIPRSNKPLEVSRADAFKAMPMAEKQEIIEKLPISGIVADKLFNTFKAEEGDLYMEMGLDEREQVFGPMADDAIERIGTMGKAKIAQAAFEKKKFEEQGKSLQERILEGVPNDKKNATKAAFDSLMAKDLQTEALTLEEKELCSQLAEKMPADMLDNAAAGSGIMLRRKLQKAKVKEIAKIFPDRAYEVVPGEIETLVPENDIGMHMPFTSEAGDVTLRLANGMAENATEAGRGATESLLRKELLSNFEDAQKTDEAYERIQDMIRKYGAEWVRDTLTSNNSLSFDNGGKLLSWGTTVKAPDGKEAFGASNVERTIEETKIGGKAALDWKSYDASKGIRENIDALLPDDVEGTIPKWKPDENKVEVRKRLERYLAGFIEERSGKKKVTSEEFESYVREFNARLEKALEIRENKKQSAASLKEKGNKQADWELYGSFFKGLSYIRNGIPVSKKEAKERLGKEGIKKLKKIALEENPYNQETKEKAGNMLENMAYVDFANPAGDYYPIVLSDLTVEYVKAGHGPEGVEISDIATEDSLPGLEQMKGRYLKEVYLKGIDSIFELNGQPKSEIEISGEANGNPETRKYSLDGSTITIGGRKYDLSKRSDRQALKSVAEDNGFTVGTSFADELEKANMLVKVPGKIGTKRGFGRYAVVGGKVWIGEKAFDLTDETDIKKLMVLGEDGNFKPDYPFAFELQEKGVLQPKPGVSQADLASEASEMIKGLSKLSPTPQYAGGEIKKGSFELSNGVITFSDNSKASFDSGNRLLKIGKKSYSLSSAEGIAKLVADDIRAGKSRAMELAKNGLLYGNGVAYNDDPQLKAKVDAISNSSLTDDEKEAKIAEARALKNTAGNPLSFKNEAGNNEPLESVVYDAQSRKLLVNGREIVPTPLEVFDVAEAEGGLQNQIGEVEFKRLQWIASEYANAAEEDPSKRSNYIFVVPATSKKAVKARDSFMRAWGTLWSPGKLATVRELDRISSDPNEEVANQRRLTEISGNKAEYDVAKEYLENPRLLLDTVYDAAKGVWLENEKDYTTDEGKKFFERLKYLAENKDVFGETEGGLIGFMKEELIHYRNKMESPVAIGVMDNAISYLEEHIAANKKVRKEAAEELKNSADYIADVDKAYLTKRAGELSDASKIQSEAAADAGIPLNEIEKRMKDVAAELDGYEKHSRARAEYFKARAALDARSHMAYFLAGKIDFKEAVEGIEKRKEELREAAKKGIEAANNDDSLSERGKKKRIKGIKKERENAVSKIDAEFRKLFAEIAKDPDNFVKAYGRGALITREELEEYLPKKVVAGTEMVKAEDYWDEFGFDAKFGVNPALQDKGDRRNHLSKRLLRARDAKERNRIINQNKLGWAIHELAENPEYTNLLPEPLTALLGPEPIKKIAQLNNMSIEEAYKAKLGQLKSVFGNIFYNRELIGVRAAKKLADEGLIPDKLDLRMAYSDPKDYEAVKEISQIFVEELKKTADKGVAVENAEKRIMASPNLQAAYEKMKQIDDNYLFTTASGSYYAKFHELLRGLDEDIRGYKQFASLEDFEKALLDELGIPSKRDEISRKKDELDRKKSRTIRDTSQAEEEVKEGIKKAEQELKETKKKLEEAEAAKEDAETKLKNATASQDLDAMRAEAEQKENDVKQLAEQLKQQENELAELKNTAGFMRDAALSMQGIPEEMREHITDFEKHLSEDMPLLGKDANALTAEEKKKVEQLLSDIAEQAKDANYLKAVGLNGLVWDSLLVAAKDANGEKVLSNAKDSITGPGRFNNNEALFEIMGHMAIAKMGKSTDSSWWNKGYRSNYVEIGKNATYALLKERHPEWKSVDDMNSLHGNRLIKELEEAGIIIGPRAYTRKGGLAVTKILDAIYETKVPGIKEANRLPKNGKEWVETIAKLVEEHHELFNRTQLEGNTESILRRVLNGKYYGSGSKSPLTSYIHNLWRPDFNEIRGYLNASGREIETSEHNKFKKIEGETKKLLKNALASNKISKEDIEWIKSTGLPARKPVEEAFEKIRTIVKLNGVTGDVPISEIDGEAVSEEGKHIFDMEYVAAKRFIAKFRALNELGPDERADINDIVASATNGKSPYSLGYEELRQQIASYKESKEMLGKLKPDDLNKVLQDAGLTDAKQLYAMKPADLRKLVKDYALSIWSDGELQKALRDESGPGRHRFLNEAIGRKMDISGLVKSGDKAYLSGRLAGEQDEGKKRIIESALRKLTPEEEEAPPEPAPKEPIAEREVAPEEPAEAKPEARRGEAKGGELEKAFEKEFERHNSEWDSPANGTTPDGRKIKAVGSNYASLFKVGNKHYFLVKDSYETEPSKRYTLYKLTDDAAKLDLGINNNRDFSDIIEASEPISGDELKELYDAVSHGTGEAREMLEDDLKLAYGKAAKGIQPPKGKRGAVAAPYPEQVDAFKQRIQEFENISLQDKTAKEIDSHIDALESLLKEVSKSKLPDKEKQELQLRINGAMTTAMAAATAALVREEELSAAAEAEQPAEEKQEKPLPLVEEEGKPEAAKLDGLLEKVANDEELREEELDYLLKTAEKEGKVNITNDRLGDAISKLYEKGLFRELEQRAEEVLKNRGYAILDEGKRKAIEEIIEREKAAVPWVGAYLTQLLDENPGITIGDIESKLKEAKAAYNENPNAFKDTGWWREYENLKKGTEEGKALTPEDIEKKAAPGIPKAPSTPLNEKGISLTDMAKERSAEATAEEAGEGEVPEKGGAPEEEVAEEAVPEEAPGAVPEERKRLLEERLAKTEDIDELVTPADAEYLLTELKKYPVEAEDNRYILIGNALAKLAEDRAIPEKILNEAEAEMISRGFLLRAAEEEQPVAKKEAKPETRREEAGRGGAPAEVEEEEIEFAPKEEDEEAAERNAATFVKWLKKNEVSLSKLIASGKESYIEERGLKGVSPLQAEIEYNLLTGKAEGKKGPAPKKLKLKKVKLSQEQLSAKLDLALENITKETKARTLVWQNRDRLATADKLRLFEGMFRRNIAGTNAYSLLADAFAEASGDDFERAKRLMEEAYIATKDERSKKVLADGAKKRGFVFKLTAKKQGIFGKVLGKSPEQVASLVRPKKKKVKVPKKEDEGEKPITDLFVPESEIKKLNGELETAVGPTGEETFLKEGIPPKEGIIKEVDEALTQEEGLGSYPELQALNSKELKEKIKGAGFTKDQLSNLNTLAEAINTIAKDDEQARRLVTKLVENPDSINETIREMFTPLTYAASYLAEVPKKQIIEEGIPELLESILFEEDEEKRVAGYNKLTETVTKLIEKQESQRKA